MNNKEKVSTSSSGRHEVLSGRFTPSPQATIKLDKAYMEQLFQALGLRQSRAIILESRKAHRASSTLASCLMHSASCGTGIENLSRELPGKREHSGAQDR